MKRFFILFALAGYMMWSCQPKSNESQEVSTENHEEQDHEETAELPETGNFGADISEEGAIFLAEALKTFEGQDSANVKLTANIEKVCQMKGCWMTLDAGEGHSVRVTFKDYGFFVPKNADGKSAIVNGVLKKKLTDVETLRHFAKDEGKPQEEIDAITEDKLEWVFVADGVIIKENS